MAQIGEKIRETDRELPTPRPAPVPMPAPREPVPA